MSNPFKNICRTCLQSGTALLSLFDKKQSTDMSAGAHSIADMLKSITSIVAADSDGLPSKVCISCISEINRAFAFRIKCEKSEQTLKQYLDQEASEEVEDEKHKSSQDPEFIKYEDLEAHEIQKLNLAHQDDNDEKNNDQFTVTEDDDEKVVLQNPENLTDELCEFSDTEEPNPFTLEDAEESENVEQAEESHTYECEKCKENFDDKEAVLRHIESCFASDEDKKTKKQKPKSAKKQPIKCPHCPVDFVHPKNLDKHIKKCHKYLLSPSKSEKMDTDNQTTEGEDDSLPETYDIENEETIIEAIEESAIKHQPAELPECPYKCTQCGAGFAQEKSLNIHIKLNKCTEEVFECLVCKKVFITKRNLVHHMKTHASYECSKCSKAFSRQDKLKAHHDVEHNGITKNQCPMCGKVFTMLSTLKDHLRTHSGEKPFLCSVCGKGFSQNTNLKQHLMRHNKTKPFKCEECNYSFVSKGELNAHIRKHTGDHPFVCDTCGTGFTTSSSLVKHRRIHTGERPYACEFCPMRFAALGTLKNHRRTHTGEKPFACSFCDRAFAQKSDCVSHMRTHTGERPYVCNVCGLSFQQCGTLKAHMKAHNDEQCTMEFKPEDIQITEDKSNFGPILISDEDVLSESQVYHANADELAGEIL